MTRTPAALEAQATGDAILVEICDVCGSSNVKEIKCKLICQNCGTILKSCSDL